MISFGIFLRMWQKNEVDISEREQWRGGKKKKNNKQQSKQQQQQKKNTP